MTKPVRPTLRCLREDLRIAIPPVTRPLDELEHPLLTKATERFAEEGTPHERIRSIDDQVLFKVKAQRWRGAVWVDVDLPWLVACGLREDGSLDDFYATLENGAKAARARYNADHSPPLVTATHCGHLLPREEDDLRYRAESAARAERRLALVVRELTRHSLLNGHEHATMLDGAALGIHVLADQGHETYVAIRIIGSVPKHLVATIISLVPGCDPGGWMSDYAMPERAMAPEEQIWSNIMDPTMAAKLLDEDS
ncbi:hypothetical protein DPM19_32635 [Actinomadura craniellae]|uniref:Uncharacterized protein n=1 Tax=Actinomadura craniellae TaxID=2231787 RepID=A0A365GW60_9ACTN|nr:hypothetical protein [Actinomadura craniellae]RAY11051.1 hypothetical protein DPM19_32635 [Actinomadura craniellae]